MKATKVNAGLAESNDRLLLGIWRDSLHVTCGLTACTPGSAPGPTLGNEYGKTLPFLQVMNVPLVPWVLRVRFRVTVTVRDRVRAEMRAYLTLAGTRGYRVYHVYRPGAQFTKYLTIYRKMDLQ